MALGLTRVLGLYLIAGCSRKQVRAVCYFCCGDAVEGVAQGASWRSRCFYYEYPRETFSSCFSIKMKTRSSSLEKDGLLFYDGVYLVSVFFPSLDC